MREVLEQLLDERIGEGLVHIRQAINSPDQHDVMLKMACYKIAAAMELREAVEELANDFFNKRGPVAPEIH